MHSITSKCAKPVRGHFTYSGTGVNVTAFSIPKSCAGTHTVIIANSTMVFYDTSFIIDVFPVPIVNAGPDKFVLEGGSATLTATASGNNLNYLWAPSTYLNSATVAQPLSSPMDDILYTLTVTSADGCIASDQVAVKLLKTPQS